MCVFDPLTIQELTAGQDLDPGEDPASPTRTEASWECMSEMLAGVSEADNAQAFEDSEWHNEVNVNMDTVKQCISQLEQTIAQFGKHENSQPLKGAPVKISGLACLNRGTRGQTYTTPLPRPYCSALARRYERLSQRQALPQRSRVKAREILVKNESGKGELKVTLPGRGAHEILDVKQAVIDKMGYGALSQMEFLIPSWQENGVTALHMDSDPVNNNRKVLIMRGLDLPEPDVAQLPSLTLQLDRSNTEKSCDQQSEDFSPTSSWWIRSPMASEATSLIGEDADWSLL